MCWRLKLASILSWQIFPPADEVEGSNRKGYSACSPALCLPPKGEWACNSEQTCEKWKIISRFFGINSDISDGNGINGSALLIPIRFSLSSFLHQPSDLRRRKIIGIKKVFPLSLTFCNLLHAFSMASFLVDLWSSKYSKCNKLSFCFSPWDSFPLFFFITTSDENTKEAEVLVGEAGVCEISKR